MFDSNFYAQDHPLFNVCNKKVIGKIKDETASVSIKKFLACKLVERKTRQPRNQAERHPQGHESCCLQWHSTWRRIDKIRFQLDFQLPSSFALLVKKYVLEASFQLGLTDTIWITPKQFNTYFLSKVYMLFVETLWTGTF